MDSKLRKKEHGDLPATVRLVKQVRSELRSEIKARFETLQAGIHRIEVLMEEQRGENRIVLDGLKTVLDRQDRLEHAQLETHGIVLSLARAKQRDI